MATQIVMDHTGDTRHYFNADDAEALFKAEERFTERLRPRTPRPAPQRFCENGCHRNSARSSMLKATSMSSVATAESDTASTMVRV